MFKGLKKAWDDVRGATDARKARDAQNAAISQQRAHEAQNKSLAQGQIDIADTMLYGRQTGNIDLATGINSSPRSGDGAEGLSKQWTSDYLDWLKNSPDLTYNAQRGAMEGQIRDSMSMAARSLGQRGLNTSNVQSGAALRTMGDIGMARAGLLSQMEAGRFDRQGERLGMGTQLTQSLMDRALNYRAGAVGQSVGMQTQIPQMMSGIAQQYQQQADQKGAMLGRAVGTIADYYTGGMASAAKGGMQPQPAHQTPAYFPPQTSQFYSFKRAPNTPYQPRTYWGS
jgi:hypothetical protein